MMECPKEALSKSTMDLLKGNIFLIWPHFSVTDRIDQNSVVITSGILSLR